MTKILYDLHIHSALSPCADNDMTPVNIGAMSSAKGLQIIAVADHNAIANVAAAREVGEALDVIVVPAVELQTQEDVHILCLFETFENLQSFFDEISFKDLKNREEIFGEQLIVSSDDEVIGREERLLLAGANLSEPDVKPLVENTAELRCRRTSIATQTESWQSSATCRIITRRWNFRPTATKKPPRCTQKNTG